MWNAYNSLLFCSLGSNKRAIAPKDDSPLEVFNTNSNIVDEYEILKNSSCLEIQALKLDSRVLSQDCKLMFDRYCMNCRLNNYLNE